MPHKIATTVLFSVLIVAFATLIVAPAQAAPPKMTVTASSVHPGNYPARYAFDGNPKTRWASKTPMSRTGEWLQIDLGKSHPINDITIRWETAHAVQYKILTSQDGKTFKVIHTQTAGKGGVEKIKDLNSKGRFLRLLATKASSHNLASIWEFSIAGVKITKTTTPAPKPAPPVDTSALTKLGVKEIVFAARESGVDGHWYANFGYYSYDSKRKLYRKEGRLCKLDLKTGKVKLLIDDPDGSVRDPAVHYDGKTIIFSWRKSGTTSFNLYQINSDGSGLKQITKTQYDDIEPTFLPDDKIMFVSSRVKRWVQCWLTPVAVLHYCDADGKNIRQISANVEHDNTPWPLPDGRILYMRWEYVDRSQVDYHHLWTTNPDGTGQMVYFGNMNPSGLFIDAKPIPGTSDVILINSPGHGGREHEGHVAIVTDKNGPDDRGSMRNVTRKRGYRDPYAISEDTFIAAYRRNLVMLTPQGREANIYTLGSEFGGRCELHEPRPLIVRKRERLRPNTVRPSMATGQLMLMDVYNGRNMKGVKKGDIKKLLIVESLPKPVNFTGGMDPMSYGGTFTLERVLGTVPVEEDGSANFILPAKRPFFFVALDANNNSVKRMHSFVSVMPGEMTSCIGCHEERKTIVSNRPTGGRPQAMKRAPSTITPNKGVPDIFDFPRDIQPILDKHCIKCHNSQKQSGGMMLTGGRGPMFSTSYFTLTWKKQFTDGRNIAVGNRAPRTVGSGSSAIMKKTNGEHNKVKLSQQEQDTIRYWIEAGAPYPGTYAALGCGSIAGYQQNRQVNTDRGWPEVKPYQAALQKRCGACHSKKTRNALPTSISDELGISFWRFDGNDKRLKYSRHRMFDFTNPEKSLLLTAPLASEAGGLELSKKTKTAKHCEKVFKDTNDPDYKALLGLITAGKKNLDTIKRFDMPGFKPRPGYIREMKRYGALPNTYDSEKDSINIYEVDKKYFESLWYYPTGTKAPKMHNDVKGGSN